MVDRDTPDAWSLIVRRMGACVESKDNLCRRVLPCLFVEERDFVPGERLPSGGRGGRTIEHWTVLAVECQRTTPSTLHLTTTTRRHDAIVGKVQQS